MHFIWQFDCLFGRANACVLLLFVSPLYMWLQKKQALDIGDAKDFVATALQSPIPQLSRWNAFVVCHLTASLAVPMYVCCVNRSTILVAVVYVISKRINVCWTLYCILCCVIVAASHFIWYSSPGMWWLGNPWHNQGCKPDHEEHIHYGDESRWAQVPSGYMYGLAALQCET